VIAAALGLAACGTSTRTGSREHACMTRVMYFESNRSSDQGMLAVGTVVMNRVESDKYPDTVCEVVGQKNQFAPGVLSRPMREGQSQARAQRMATRVLAGERHRRVGDALFFHTAGHNFPYRNMHYVAIAGGNAFYERRNPRPGQRNRSQVEVARATPPERPSRPVREGPVPMPEVAEIEVARLPEPAPAAPVVAVAAAQPPPPPPLQPVLAPAPVAPPLVLTPTPVLAAMPEVPPPVSIEQLIMLNGG
jgi:spore germination cell wall hydrolase CwlJ-like protein